MAHAEPSSYEHLRQRVVALRNELAMAEQVLALREEEKRAERGASESEKAVAPVRRQGRRRLRRADATALVTRVALRRAALERRRDLARMLVVGIVVSMATAALVVLAVRALDAPTTVATVAQPIAKLHVPPAPPPHAPVSVAPADPAPPARAPAKVQTSEPHPMLANPWADDVSKPKPARPDKWGF
jgi:hypothetical protein